MSTRPKAHNQGTSDADLRQLLLLTYNYYDPGTRSLKDQAIAEIIAKALFLAPNKCLPEWKIREEVSRLMSIPKLDQQQIDAGLSVLRDSNAAVLKSKNWVLKSHEIERLQKDLDAAQRATADILSTYFPIPIEHDQLKQWFLAAGAAFFGQYDELVERLICRDEAIHLSAQEILKSALQASIAEAHLEDHAAELSQGFRAFLDDYKKPVVYAQVWAFAQAMLAAKIVTATIGADPITALKFRNAEIYLDTNAVFRLLLDGEGWTPLNDLVESLAQIGAKLYVIPETIEEYNRVLRRKREAFTSVFGAVGGEILDRSGDEWWKTIKAKGPVTSATAAAFFDHMGSLLENEEITGKITLNDSNEVVAAAEAGKKNGKLIKDIAEQWKKFHAWDKPAPVIAHDAALASVCTHLRKSGKNAWTLSTDRSMQAIASHWAGQRDMPSWVSLDAFIQILAITGAGPAHDPKRFAPLLAALVRAEVHPRENAFRVEDVALLLDQEEQINEVPIEEIQILAVRASQNRLSGKSNDAVFKDLRRVIQRQLKSGDERIRELQRQVTNSEAKHAEAVRRASSFREVLISALTPTHMLRLYVKSALWIIGGMLLAGLCFWFGEAANTAGQHVLSDFMYFCMLPGFGVPLYPAMGAFRDIRAEATESAAAQADIHLQSIA